MKTINFNNHKFQISKDGILYWFDKQIAIISDLHLEKGSSFGPSGQFLPPYDSEETLTKLLSTIKNYNITKVILLGDTFHDKNALSRMSNKVLILFETFIKKYEVIFVLGNHETKMQLENIKFFNEYVLDGIHFIHQTSKKSIYQISGHYHPVATIRTGSKKITGKCFIHEQYNLIMPSYGVYTGGLNIKNALFKNLFKKEPNVYFLGKRSVYKFPYKFYL